MEASGRILTNSPAIRLAPRSGGLFALLSTGADRPLGGPSVQRTAGGNQQEGVRIRDCLSYWKEISGGQGGQQDPIP